MLLGAEGYALTTLSCALDVLADGDDSGEQPVLDLGGAGDGAATRSR